MRLARSRLSRREETRNTRGSPAHARLDRDYTVVAAFVPTLVLGAGVGVGWRSLNCNSRFDGNGQLPRARDRLNHDVLLLDTACQQLVLAALEQGLDDGGIPAGVDDTDAQGAAVVLLRGRSLERACHDCGCRGLLFVFRGALECN